MVVYSPKISQKSTIIVENNTFWWLFLLDITIRHGPYHRSHHFIASFVESKPDNTELSHQYCADIGDGISTKYLVTTMIISHFNHLLWEVNRGNCRLQRAVYPCLFISNTQLQRNVSTTGIFLVRFHHKFSWPLAMPIQEADLEILYFRTKIVSDNEPSDQIVPFILLSNHALRCIHEISNLVVHFLR